LPELRVYEVLGECETYPPDPLPLDICEGKGESFF
jgi:hypothetical protein